MNPKANKILPHKLSAGIREALRDLEAVEACNDTYNISMCVWYDYTPDCEDRHRENAPSCSVCFAGSVMMRSLGFPGPDELAERLTSMLRARVPTAEHFDPNDYNALEEAFGSTVDVDDGYIASIGPHVFDQLGFSEDESRKLYALDLIRSGASDEIYDGLVKWLGEPTDNERQLLRSIAERHKNCHAWPTYHQDPVAFKQARHTLADNLEAAGF